MYIVFTVCGGGIRIKDFLICTKTIRVEWILFQIITLVNESKSTSFFLLMLVEKEKYRFKGAWGKGKGIHFLLCA